MNAINLQPLKNNEKVNGYKIGIKNKLLDLRYHVKKKCFFIKTIIFFEAILIKMHLIANHNGYNTSIKNTTSLLNPGSPKNRHYAHQI